jgi:GNAT superfamily N-acetyltransferase
VASLVVRVLAADDNRSDFRSGDPDLDRFLAKYAGQNQFRHYIGTTYVAAADDRIGGYATVAAGEIEIDDLPDVIRRKYPRYPLPVLRLARLAVDERAQGQGVGSALLGYVLHLAVKMSVELGCVGVLVDAKPGAIACYETRGFMALEALEGAGTARPAPTPMFLSIRDIKANLED